MVGIDGRGNLYRFVVFLPSIYHGGIISYSILVLDPIIEVKRIEEQEASGLIYNTEVVLKWVPRQWDHN
jgi:hypothetical protein